MVTSGSVAFGKQKLTEELVMSLSMRETLSKNNGIKARVCVLLFFSLLFYVSIKEK